jgi:hypothetical protein
MEEKKNECAQRTIEKPRYGRKIIALSKRYITQSAEKKENFLYLWAGWIRLENWRAHVTFCSSFAETTLCNRV